MDAPKLHRTSVGSAGSGNLIRKVEFDDIEPILEMAVRVYGNVNVSYGRAFILGNLMNPSILMVCTDRAFGCAYIHDYQFLHNTREATMEFLAAEAGAGWDAYFILKKMIEWSEEMGASEFSIRPTGEVSLDIFAKRLGFRKDLPSYSLSLERKLH